MNKKNVALALSLGVMMASRIVLASDAPPPSGHAYTAFELYHAMLKNPFFEHGQTVVLDSWSIPVYPDKVPRIWDKQTRKPVELAGVRYRDCPEFPPPRYEHLALRHVSTPAELSTGSRPTSYQGVAGLWSRDGLVSRCLGMCEFSVTVANLDHSFVSCGRLVVIMSSPGWSDLDIFQTWDVEPLGFIDANTLPTLPIGLKVPAVRFWRLHRVENKTTDSHNKP